jgi:hypothetical protein
MKTVQLDKARSAKAKKGVGQGGKAGAKEEHVRRGLIGEAVTAYLVMKDVLVERGTVTDMEERIVMRNLKPMATMLRLIRRTMTAKQLLKEAGVLLGNGTLLKNHVTKNRIVHALGLRTMSIQKTAGSKDCIGALLLFAYLSKKDDLLEELTELIEVEEMVNALLGREEGDDDDDDDAEEDEDFVESDSDASDISGDDSAEGGDDSDGEDSDGEDSEDSDDDIVIASGAEKYADDEIIHLEDDDDDDEDEDEIDQIMREMHR